MIVSCCCILLCLHIVIKVGTKHMTASQPRTALNTDADGGPGISYNSLSTTLKLPNKKATKRSVVRPRSRTAADAVIGLVALLGEASDDSAVMSAVDESSSEYGCGLGLSWKRSFWVDAFSSSLLASPMVMEREVMSGRVGTHGWREVDVPPSDVLVDGSRTGRDDSPVAP